MAGTMKELIEMIARALVDNPEQVVVMEVVGEQTTVLELRVAQSDLGKIIGVEAWVGCLVEIEPQELTPLPEGSYYHFEFEGCEVFDETGLRLGEVTGVEDHGGNTLLVLRTAGGREILVPTAKEYLLEI